MSHPDPWLVAAHPLAVRPFQDGGAGRSLRMIATGSETATRFGLLEYRLARRTPGASPHYRQTFSESSFVLSGELTLYVNGWWQPYRPGDNDGDEPASVLILFTPGVARETFFAGMAELGRSGRRPSTEEMAAISARHDQVMVDV